MVSFKGSVLLVMICLLLSGCTTIQPSRFIVMTGGQGSNGSQGVQGLNGSNGVSINITSVTFSNGGNMTINWSNNQSFTSPNLTGAKGDQGATGASGSTGATGAQGLNGSNGIDGSNASYNFTNPWLYQNTSTICIENGTINTTNSLAYWSLDNASTSNLIYDSTGKYNLTDPGGANSPTFNTTLCKHGGCAGFSGDQGSNSDYFTNTAWNTAISPTEDFTMGCWLFQQGGAADQAAISTGNGGNSDREEIRIIGTSNYVGTVRAGGVESQIRVDSQPYGQWQFLVMTYTESNTTMSLWKNGTFIGSNNSKGTASQESEIRLGVFGNAVDDGWYGLIDECFVYDRALSGSEIVSRWNGGNGLFPPFSTSNCTTTTSNVIVFNDTQLNVLNKNVTLNGNLVIQNITPIANNTYDLGNSTNRWRVVYGINVTTGDLIFKNNLKLSEPTGDQVCMYNVTGGILWCTGQTQSVFNNPIIMNTTGNKPTCTSSIRGSGWVTFGGLGVADVYEVCLKTVLDTYLWVATT